MSICLTPQASSTNEREVLNPPLPGQFPIPTAWLKATPVSDFTGSHETEIRFYQKQFYMYFNNDMDKLSICEDKEDKEKDIHVYICSSSQAFNMKTYMTYLS